MIVKHRGFADETVVIVKLKADEGMVTYLRVKLSESGRDKLLEMKGGTCEWNYIIQSNCYYKASKKKNRTNV